MVGTGTPSARAQGNGGAEAAQSVCLQHCAACTGAYAYKRAFLPCTPAAPAAPCQVSMGTPPMLPPSILHTLLPLSDRCVSSACYLPMLRCIFHSPVFLTAFLGGGGSDSSCATAWANGKHTGRCCTHSRSTMAPPGDLPVRGAQPAVSELLTANCSQRVPFMRAQAVNT